MSANLAVSTARFVRWLHLRHTELSVRFLKPRTPARFVFPSS